MKNATKTIKLEEKVETLSKQVKSMKAEITDLKHLYNDLRDMFMLQNPAVANAPHMPAPVGFMSYIPDTAHRKGCIPKISIHSNGGIIIGVGLREQFNNPDNFNFVSFSTTPIQDVFGIRFHTTHVPNSYKIQKAQGDRIWHVDSVKLAKKLNNGTLPTSTIQMNAGKYEYSANTAVVWPSEKEFALNAQELEMCDISSKNIKPKISALKNGKIRINSAARALVDPSFAYSYIDIVRSESNPNIIGFHFTNTPSGNNSHMIKSQNNGSKNAIEICEKPVADMLFATGGIPKHFTICPVCGTTLICEISE